LGSSGEQVNPIRFSRFDPAGSAAWCDWRLGSTRQCRSRGLDRAHLTPPDTRRLSPRCFNAKVTVLVGNVRHHIRDEEHGPFPDVRAQLGRKPWSNWS
jgi:hypothetical protein